MTILLWENISVSKQKQMFLHSFLFSLLIGCYLSFFSFCFVWHKLFWSRNIFTNCCFYTKPKPKPKTVIGLCVCPSTMITCEDISVSKQKQMLFSPNTDPKKILPFPFFCDDWMIFAFFSVVCWVPAFLEQKYPHK